MANEKAPPRILVIGCEVVARELYALAAVSPRVLDITLLPKGLHDLETDKMRERLQEEIDKADPSRHDAVALAYGLCNNGTVGLRAGDVPLIIPRTHDCISFFFGSAARYKEYFDANPGTYYRTTGWSERGASDLANDIMSQLGLSQSYSEYVEKYGKDNADYIMGVLGGWKENYRRMTYIRMPLEGLPDYAGEAKAEADENNWEFDVVDGDTSILARLTRGEWDEASFCVAPPGATIVSGAEDEILASREGSGDE